jgi:hypothetical protein
MAEIVYLATRRDHAGNHDVLMREDGTSYAWNLSEAEADGVIEHTQRNHRKPHGQSYWKWAYPKGTLREFLKKEGIRY